MNSSPHRPLPDSANDVRSANFDAVAEAAAQRLAQNKCVRRNLPGRGRLRIDRQLPFLCVYRSPTEGEDTGTRELVTTEAAYLFAPGDPQYHQGISRLCQQIHLTMQEHFGTFLFLEIWSKPTSEQPGSGPESMTPSFEIITPDLDSLPSTIDAFEESLAEIAIQGHRAQVRVRRCDRVVPPGLRPLEHASPQATAGGCCVVGLAVEPIYRDPQTGTLFPILLQTLRWQLAAALRKAIAQFTGLESTSEELHFESLGPSSLVKAARLVDQQLSEVAESFDFLLQVTPTNANAAWDQFRDSHWTELPAFHYRPLPYRPNLLKRRLFDIEIERIEDPTLAHLFWEKQDEVDRQLTALRQLDTPNFLLSSMQLYGAPDETLIKLAREILDAWPTSRLPEQSGDYLPVDDVVARAREEIDHYRQQLRPFNATVEVCDHIASGIMVSHDRLLISENLCMRAERLEPLMHHEIGTHLLTYFNGRCQPFQQLYAGLAGYDELQEGLAVLAEYLCGGLTARRLRTLAGRVIAVQSMIDGAEFSETFSLLHDEYGFSGRPAFVTTLRAYRGGGLTKDIIYLRGLRDLLEYLRAGHDVEPLYVGKIGLRHIPFVQEMRRRGIIDAPSVLPRFWDQDQVRDRLEACRNLTVPQLLETDQ